MANTPFGNLTSNTSSAAIKAEGKTIICVSGTIGGGTVSVERQLPDGTWQSLESVTALEKTWYFDLKPCDLRITLSGATAPNIIWSIL